MWLFSSLLLVGVAYAWTEEKVLSVSNGAWSYDIGAAEFNSKFWASSGVIKRSCSDCTVGWQTIYYKRLTDLKTFAAYSYFRTSWFSSNNILNDDFEMYSTIEDLEAGTNKWTFCNYDDTNIGPFRDCGPTAYKAGEWVSNGRGGKTADFYILTDCADEDCDDGDICNGGEYCLDGQCTSGQDLECPADFVCSSERQRCVRDCDTFAIDGYLRDCSEEFDYIKTDIAGVIDQASDNLESIDSLQTQVTTNTNNLETVTTNVDEVNTVIGGERESWGDSESILDQLVTLNDRMNDVDSLLTRIDAVEARLDTIEERLFGYSPQTDQGENSDNSYTSPDEVASANSVPLMTVNGYEVNWVGFVVAAAVLLLVVNVVLMVNNLCCGKDGKSRKQYEVVYQDSADEHFERARLNK